MYSICPQLLGVMFTQYMEHVYGRVLQHCNLKKERRGATSGLSLHLCMNCVMHVISHKAVLQMFATVYFAVKPCHYYGWELEFLIINNHMDKKPRFKCKLAIYCGQSNIPTI